ncbi:TIGR03118 family protein [Occallatibacter savannae]|uniref:TIGR03118 family protein n=1 Tax=Occallatibacter savannae TaxID=1002691 RepID=UPI000D699002|nr:TIGR03118 family protein [Occallatibacter savannae]
MLRKFQFLVFLVLLSHLSRAQTPSGYTQTNLVSDGSVKAQQTDPQLINPWGVAIGQQTPFWINTAGTGLSEIYDAGANKQFTVKIPAPAGKTGTPTGIVFNTSPTDFAVPHGAASLFIFDSLDGTISAWNSNMTDAATVVDNSTSGAVYTGLAIVANGAANYLLAANFAQDKIDVFDAKFAPHTLSGSFTDPSIPAGFAPFNVHVINNQVFVMYAQQNPNGGPALAGTGYVSIFDNNGNFVQRAISGGHLDAPWGITLAPASFGQFGGDLLIGNFGDGTISAYDPTTFALKGQLNDPSGAPIQIEDLWELTFGSGSTGDPNTLYFAAGVNHEKGGLFGAITAAAPHPAGDFSMNLAQSSLTVAQGGSASVQLNLVPANGFASKIDFSVSGLPAGVTFQFSPASVTPTAGAASSTMLRITAGTYTPPSSPYTTSRLQTGRGSLSLAALLPLGLFALAPILRNRKAFLKRTIIGGSAISVLLLCIIVSGCGGTKAVSANPTPTPKGTSTLTITATSGSLTHTTTLALTVR